MSWGPPCSYLLIGCIPGFLFDIDLIPANINVLQRTTTAWLRTKHSYPCVILIVVTHESTRISFVCTHNHLYSDNLLNRLAKLYKKIVKVNPKQPLEATECKCLIRLWLTLPLEVDARTIIGGKAEKYAPWGLYIPIHVYTCIHKCATKTPSP